MNLFKTTLLLSLCLLSQTWVMAQDWTNYQSQGQINDLVETDTELHLATDAGLVVVNKATLEKTIYNKSNSNLPSNHIQSITQDDSGKSWIGTYDMIIGRFTGNDIDNITPIEHPAVLNYTELYDIEINSQGEIWVGSKHGVFQQDGSNWNHYDEDEFGPNYFETWDLEINEADEVFAAGFEFHKFSNGAWTSINSGTTLEGYLDADFFFSSAGDLWLSGDLNHIGKYDGTEWTQYPIDFNGSEVIGFTEDQDATVFFFTQQDGIFKLENDVFVQQSDAQTIAVDNLTKYFHIDQDNNRWINSEIYLSVNEGGTIRNTLISQHTLESSRNANISKGKNGKMYFITGSNNNFSVVDEDGVWSFLPTPESAAQFESFQEILALADNDIWALSSEALYHYNGNSWTKDSSIQGFGLEMDSNGKIYIRSTQTIFILDNGTVTTYTPDNSMLSEHILFAHGIDQENNLWIGASDFYEDDVIQKVSTDGTWTTYSSIDHEAIIKPEGKFHFDVNGNIWVPSRSVGAIKFDGTTFSNPIKENITQVENYNAFSIESDASGKLFFSHQYGVTTLFDDEFKDLLIEDVPAEDNSSNSTITFDSQGNLWWGSNREGVFVYNGLVSNTTAPHQLLSEDLKLYPNPASGYATLDFSTLKKANVAVNIYNNLGQLVLNSTLGVLPKGSYQEVLDIEKLTAGFYTIQLIVDQETSAKILIIE